MLRKPFGLDLRINLAANCNDYLMGDRHHRTGLSEHYAGIQGASDPVNGPELYKMGCETVLSHGPFGERHC